MFFYLVCDTCYIGQCTEQRQISSSLFVISTRLKEEKYCNEIVTIGKRGTRRLWGLTSTWRRNQRFLLLYREYSSLQAMGCILVYFSWSFHWILDMKQTFGGKIYHISQTEGQEDRVAGTWGRSHLAVFTHESEWWSLVLSFLSPISCIMCLPFLFSLLSPERQPLWWWLSLLND